MVKKDEYKAGTLYILFLLKVNEVAYTEEKKKKKLGNLIQI